MIILSWTTAASKNSECVVQGEAVQSVLAKHLNFEQVISDSKSVI